MNNSKPNLNQSLSNAVSGGEISEVKRLIKLGADVKGNSESGYLLPIFSAAQDNEGEIALLLIQNGADINVREKWDKNTPLHHAANFGSEKVVKVLLGNGADRNLANNNGKRPIDLASSLAVAKLLVQTDKEKAVLQKKQQEGEKIINKLEEIGFFKYVKSEYLKKVKAKTLDNLLAYGTLSGGFNEVNLESLNPKEYSTDSEDLAESGIGNVIDQMKNVLGKMNLKITSCKDKYPPNSEYIVEVNGKNHLVFEKDDKDSSWSKAHKRLLEIVNELLEEAGSNERLFSQYFNNDARSIFLTPEQYDYISSLEIIDPEWDPAPSTFL